MFTGIPAALTGNIASSCNTVAPIYANSRNSLYVIVLIGSGLLTILGSQIRHPLTSVQFSYNLALVALATIDPVTSEPPLENVFIVPFGIDP